MSQNISESEVSQILIMKARELFNATLMRNNSGAFHDGTRSVRYGLNNLSVEQNKRTKSSDYIGPTVITVTPDMVGKQIAVFSAVEMKKPDWVRNPKDPRENAQEVFINWIKSIGGFAGFAKDIDSLTKIFKP